MSKVRFYRYYFLGLAKPITMETTDRGTADEMLKELNHRTNGSIKFKNLIDIRVETPIVGISEKKISGIDYVWVGLESAQGGWMSKENFNKIINKNKKNN
jgi:hypothetical protein